MDLILLIGTNPLPNLVVAYKLLGEVDRFYLIYSEQTNNQNGTKDFADNIAQLLVKNKEISKEKIFFKSLSDVSSAKTIQHDLQDVKFESENVHLNYTGGTKAMAVHVYQFLKNKFGNNFSASYLDARTHTLIYDNDSHKNSRDLRKDINIPIEDMLSLHNYKIKGVYKNLSYKQFSKQTKQIAEWIKEESWEEKLKLYKEYIPKIFKPNNRLIDFKKGSLATQLEKCSQLESDFIRQLAQQEEYKNWLLSFGEKSILDKRTGKLWRPLNEDTNKTVQNRLEDSIKYLDGFWLENLIGQCIDDWAREKKLEDGFYGYSLKAKKDNDGNHKNFELDAFVINGYQLTGISMTTDGDSYVKNKGFEVLHRVKQIGGDESKAVLITGISKNDLEKTQNKIDLMEDDLSLFTGTTKESFKIVSKEGYLDIKNTLNTFLKQNKWKIILRHY